MCGHDWCSVRISKEIQGFASGKAQGFARANTAQTDALTEEQTAILEQRGVLSPEEILRLATKTRRAVGARRGAKAACHSDQTSDLDARQIQDEKLVQLRRVSDGSNP